MVLEKQLAVVKEKCAWCVDGSHQLDKMDTFVGEEERRKKKSEKDHLLGST